MPNQIGTALSGLGTDAMNVWNALPSFGGSAPAAAPTTGLTESSIGPSSPNPNSGAPGTFPVGTAPPTWSAPAPVAAPAGSTSLDPGTGSVAAPTSTSPNPTGAPPASPGTPTNWGGDLKTGGTLLAAIAQALQSYQRYNLSQNLQNPAYVSKQIQGLTQPLSAALKRSVGSGVQAQMQEAGLGEAPGLFRQALAQALAPYQLQQQQEAEQEYLQAVNQSEGVENDMGSDLSSFTKALGEMYGQG